MAEDISDQSAVAGQPIQANDSLMPSHTETVHIHLDPAWVSGIVSDPVY